MHYLDYQATTPLAPEARRAMGPWLADADDAGAGYANPASPYRAGRAASVAVEQARDAVAALLPPGGRVIFTSGATEAVNWVIQKAPRGSADAVAGTAVEHAAVRQNVIAAGGQELPVDADGLIASGWTAPDDGLVCVMAVNNEIGTIQPVADAARIAAGRRALMLCDAVQAFGRIPLPAGPDFIAVTAHKIHGPKGIGALWIRAGVDLPPLLLGGAQEQGMRAGTVATALCVGFGAAATVAADRMDADAAHARHLQALALDRLRGWWVNGSLDQRWPGNLNVRRDGVNATRLLSDCRSVAFSLGSACGSGSGRSSHVLRAIGLSDVEARSSIRLGWGRYTTEQALGEALDAIGEAADAQARGWGAAT